jgi:hypothetical protein
MSGRISTAPRRPPPLYRLARSLRRVSLLLLVLLILFAGSVVYSTSELAQSPPQVGSFSAGFDANGTMSLTSSLTVSNPGFFPIQSLTLEARVANESDVFLGAFGLGPTAIGSQATEDYPITLYLPVSATGPGASLLVDSQELSLNVWGNATFGYLFPAGLYLQNDRFWGAPFSDFTFSVGNVSENGTVPVSIAYQNAASFAEVGSLRIVLLSATGISCGGGFWTLNVGPGTQFDQTQPVTLAAGCSPFGGRLTGEYITADYTVPLPSEAIP